jgi:biotin carboxyl carrier protein
MIHLKSELMGVVFKVSVEEGQALAAGDTVLLLECMKVEIPIVAPTACTVTEVVVDEGSQIAEGQLVAILQPEDA